MVLFGMLLSFTGTARAQVNFNRDIRPILSDRCFHCHGPSSKRKGKLRLDRPDGELGAYRERKGSIAIKPGDLSKSALWERINTKDKEDVMPPTDSHKKPLTASEKELIKKWITEGAKYEKYWAFIPPTHIAPPKIVKTTWSKGIVDPYVMASLEKKKLQPKPEADKRTLIRRLSFDLTGLPPSLKEIDAFLKDKSPEAYEKLVDRLLAKKAYGEHMTRFWADVVRMADTAGMHKDFPRDFSAYRTWLIRSFNDNLKYDQFIQYQVAGDLFPNASVDQQVASGFNRLHLIIDAGTALPEESFHKNVLDRVEAFGTAFMGLTIQCAQCHDHKYDPIRQKDFYQLYAFFNNFDGKPETRGAPRNGLQPPFIKLPGGGAAMVMKERGQPRPTHVLIRGAYDKPGDKVERNTPAFLPPMKKKAGPASRMDLAQWLVDAKHPLTARVAVNRFWQQLFGVGLVKTSEDLGTQGEWPSHPQVLDELALSFVESGWDVKKLIRQIVLSNTYRQSSDAKPAEYKVDPENRWLARGSRYRLDAEVIRDQILFLSGKLNVTLFGKSVKPPQPPGLWKAVSMARPNTYVADKGDSIYRRSLYIYRRRAIPPPQLTLLNAPSREFCTSRRERTNTPLQALLLMNETEFFKAAQACAIQTLEQVKGNTTKGLTRVYEQVTSQVPDSKQMALMRRALSDFRSAYSRNKALTNLVTADLKDADFKKRVEVAAWTMITHGLFNLELTKVRR
jgi:hypothetical protein